MQQTANVDPFLQDLKAQTRAEHDAIERVIRLTDASVTLASYRRTLERLHGFHRPLEERLLDPRFWDDAPLELDARRKTAWLAADLRDLGVDAAALPLCERLPTLETPGDRWGCLYVLEGATLGGQIIGRHLRDTLGLTAEHGARFFHAYGGRTGSMWNGYRSALTMQARSDDTRRAVVASAVATYRSLRCWMSEECA